MKKDLLQRFDLLEEKLEVMYPEFNSEKFTFENPYEDRSLWRTKFGFTENDFVIGMVTSGNFKKRNLGLLIDAFKEISQRE